MTTTQFTVDDGVDPMFPLAPGGGQAEGQRLSGILRALRRHRRLRSAEVADAMSMAQRSYEYFEAGCGRLNLERVTAFAEATGTDAFAILAALSIGSNEFAVRTADNKLMLLLMLALQDFDAAVGDDILRLDARTLISAFTRMFTELGHAARRSDPLVDDWLGRPAEDPAG
jgi:hypothetical protein